MGQGHEWALGEGNGIPAGTVFAIPRYQRGYRWTKEEVTALLEDLAEFATSEERIYCLQPLVVQPLADGKYIVVDGQQRLTTLAIILRALGMERGWDIEYTAEGGKRLDDLLGNPGGSINDHFRGEARQTVEAWQGQEPGRADALRKVFTGEGGKQIVFLQHEIGPDEDGHDVFKRLNSGKTPLTSSELVRALFMEAGNGLDDGEKANIAKEWDGIESAMEDGTFWAIWPKERFRDVPTRMDFLFSLVANVPGNTARQDSLAVYRAMEKRTKAKGLQEVWEEVLRCWWWMQSCYLDTEAYHLLGWLALFTGGETRVRYREQWREAAGCRMEAFIRVLRKRVAEAIGDGEFDSFRYAPDNAATLHKVFVLLNALEAERKGARFRFDLYRNDSWDVEHIASQTDNPLTGPEEREEWLRLAKAEMSGAEWDAVDALDSFEAKLAAIVAKFSGTGEDAVVDKDGMGNLALLDASTNRAYKNAIFPSKRRQVLLRVREAGGYVPPATEAAFSKAYSPGAAQMRYWSKSDSEAFHDAMKTIFEDFMTHAKEESK